jgi:hypothetical protein
LFISKKAAQQATQESRLAKPHLELQSEHLEMSAGSIDCHTSRNCEFIEKVEAAEVADERDHRNNNNKIGAFKPCMVQAGKRSCVP